MHLCLLVSNILYILSIFRIATLLLLYCIKSFKTLLYPLIIENSQERVY